MKHLLRTVTFLCAIYSMASCSKSGSGTQPVDPTDTTTNPPPSEGYSYAYDSSFKSTGSFATMGALQADGKIIVANYTQVARLNQDGTLDNSFATGTTTRGEFHSLALQKDGKVLLGGNFTSYNGQSQAYCLRLNTDGSVDNTFTTLKLTPYNVPPHIDIRSIGIQSDRKILLGGNLFYLAYQVGNYLYGPTQLVRVNENGSYDSTFQHGVDANFVNCLHVLPDDKILVTGQWVVDRIAATDSTQQQNYNYIVRLDPNGRLDRTFRWSTPYFFMSDTYRYLQAYGKTIEVQDDGKILLGGRFQYTSDDQSENYSNLIRLKSDGSIDNTFPLKGFRSIIPAVHFTSDRLIIGTAHDSDVQYQDANVAILQVNKNGTKNESYKVKDFTGFGDTQMILEDAQKNLILIGKFYDKMGVGVYTFHGVIRLKRL